MKKNKWIYDIYLDEDCLFDGEQIDEPFDSKKKAIDDAEKRLRSFAKFYGRSKKDFTVNYEYTSEW